MYCYKADSPSETVNRIRGLLNAMGIETSVEKYQFSHGLYSCRVTITNGFLKHCNIGCNGKGTSADYAIASGYAELMERLQNRALGFEGLKYAVQHYQDNQYFPQLPFQRKIKNTLKFYLCPDEEVVSANESELQAFLSSVNPEDSTKNLLPKELIEESFNIVLADFYNLTLNRIEKHPIEMMRYLSDTTGMCAGNNYAEAVLQGIYEICERYVLQAIYLNKATMPLCKKDIFSSTTIQLLDEMESKGIEYYVINCSLEGLFPVIGLLVYEQVEGCFTYSFRLGADIDINIALTRCITEICQGLDKQDRIEFWTPREKIFTTYEYHRSLVNGSGRVLLKSFDFDNYSDVYLDNIKKTNRHETLLSLINHYKKRKIEFWVRDNSYLGFPSFYVYSPQLSPVSSKLRSNNPYIPYQLSSKGFYNINPKYRLNEDLSGFDINNMDSILEINIGKTLFFYPYAIVQKDNSCNSLLFLLEFRIKNRIYDKALDCLQVIHEYFYIKPSYFNALEKALVLAMAKEEKESIYKSIKDMDTPESIEEIISLIDNESIAVSDYPSLKEDELFITNSAYLDWINVQASLSNSFSTSLKQGDVLNKILESD